MEVNITMTVAEQAMPKQEYREENECKKAIKQWAVQAQLTRGEKVEKKEAG